MLNEVKNLVDNQNLFLVVNKSFVSHRGCSIFFFVSFFKNKLIIGFKKIKH